MARQTPAYDGEARENSGDADELRRLTQETRRIWDSKAAYWDERMGEGNQFQQVLVGPASERLLELRAGELVLDVACGNGVMSRRLAGLGAKVVATDFSATFLERAQARAPEYAASITYVLADATDETQLLGLGEGRFDAAVCNMALQDMTTIEPLLRALARLLKPAGRFVFSIPHPAFNNPAGSTLVLEEADKDGRLVELRAVKVAAYLQVPASMGAGMPGEPSAHYYFHRPLGELFGACFAAGFVLDAMEEPAFGAQDQAGRALGWANYRSIPPVLVARLRLVADRRA